jgi:hypothetical protein
VAKLVESDDAGRCGLLGGDPREIPQMLLGFLMIFGSLLLSVFETRQRGCSSQAKPGQAERSRVMIEESRGRRRRCDLF